MRGIPDREPEKPKERALRRLSAGAYCCMPEPCVHTEESCKTCACLCWPHSYAQRAAMAWGPSVPWHCLRTEPCARRDSQKRCIGSDPCDIEGCTPTELMICDHAGECKKVRDPGCSHDKPHESLRWGKTWCTDTHNGFHRCCEDSKCIPYHEEDQRDWFVVSMSKILQGPHLQAWDLQEWEAKALCIGGQRAFRWSQGVRGLGNL